MAEETVYRRLAQHLDAIPNGFPATESGVELRLLAKMFTPQEAALASELRLRYESAETIAARAGMDPKEALALLREMVRKGLARFRRNGGELGFALLPFIVGIYEEQLPRMDAELAALTEQYFLEVRGRTYLDAPPAIHRVIPVGEAVPPGLEVFPYESAVAIVESARSWGVRDCICRVQQRQIGKGCDHPLEACLNLAPVENAFHEGEVTRPITKEEALHILRQAEESGLIHSTGNYRDGHFYICNCCTCCCGVLRGLVEFGVPGAVARSPFHTVVDAEACVGCGACVERCPMGALSVPEDVCQVDVERCLGCGLCASACAVGALHLERRPEVLAPPANLIEWGLQRAQARGLTLEEVL